MQTTISDTLQQTDAIMRQLPGYFVLKTLDSKFCYANNNAARLLGFQSPDDLMGKTDAELNCAAAEYAEGFVHEDQLVQQHQYLKFISHFNYANEVWRTCIYEKSVFKNDVGAIAGISCYVMDVTDCHLIDLTRYLLKTDHKYHYEFCRDQFAYVLNEGYLDYGLTDRESQCLFFVIRGKSSKAIANILNISTKTVEYYLERLKHKLTCRDKSELIETALTKGLLNIIPSSLIKQQLLHKMET